MAKVKNRKCDEVLPEAPLVDWRFTLTRHEDFLLGGDQYDDQYGDPFDGQQWYAACWDIRTGGVVFGAEGGTVTVWSPRSDAELRAGWQELTGRNLADRIRH